MAADEKPEPATKDALRETFVSKLPIFPWELTMAAGAAWWVEKQPDGRVVVKLCPIANGPQGAIPLPPAVVFAFDPDGWERFKRDVAADGTAPPPIQTATVIPGGKLH